MIIDSQVHCYERNRPERPWIGTLAGPDEVTGDDMVKAMDAVGVAGALLVSPWSMYRYDASYALEVYARHAARFALIKPFDPTAADVADQVQSWAELPGTVGARIVLLEDTAPGSKQMQALINAATQANLPVNVLCWGRLDLFAELARSNPYTQLVLDHCGLTQTFKPPPPENPFADLDEVLALAAFDNVVIKISGACTLSRQPYPFSDIWPPLAKVFQAYGMERCLWGSDWTRATAFVDYAAALNCFLEPGHLSASEQALVMGGNLSRIYGWAPSGS